MNPLATSLGLACLLAAGNLAPAEPLDPGKETIGRLATSVLLATDGDPAVAGRHAGEVTRDVAARLRETEHLRFAHYRLLGSETCGIYRSYENWSQPLAPSDEVLVRFEAQSGPLEPGLRLDLELWLSRKKILKTDVIVSGQRPVYILGPRWRGGRLIVAVALAPGPKPGQ
jgi:hypothetical protein